LSGFIAKTNAKNKRPEKHQKNPTLQAIFEQNPMEKMY
jgi:hypothetical protein